jgi:DNA polymerase-3 subunit gamma/tau
MRFDLKRMDPKTIQDYLLKIASSESLELESDAAAILSRAADGSMRDALSLLDQALALSKDKKIDSAHVRSMLGFSSKENVYELFNAMINNDAKAIFDKTDFLYQSGVDPSFLMKDVMDVLYWIICLKTLPQLKNDKSHPEFDREQGSAIADKVAINALMQLWQFFSHQQELVAKSHQPLHAFQVICLEAMYLSTLPSLEALIKTANNNTLEVQTTLGEKKKLT